MRLLLLLPDTPPSKKFKAEGSSPESLPSANPCAGAMNATLLVSNASSLANSSVGGSSAAVAAANIPNSIQGPNSQAMSQGVTGQLPNSAQQGFSSVPQQSASGSQQDVTNSSLLPQNNIDDNLDVSRVYSVIVIDGFHGAFYHMEAITSPYCRLIGQYPHHMTLCPPVAIVKRCYGTHV